MQNNKGLRYSVFLHGALLLLLVFGLPDFMQSHIEPEPFVVVDIELPPADKSNAKPEQKSEEKPKHEIAEEKTTRKATSEASKAAAAKPIETPKEPEKPVTPPPDAVPILKKQPPPPKPPVVKPPTPKPPKPKAPKEESLDDILKGVKDTAVKSVKESEKTKESLHPTDVKQNQHDVKAPFYDPNVKIGMSDKNNILSQVQQKWSPPLGAKDAQNLIVPLHFELTEDGTVTKVELAKDKGRYASDPFFRSAVDSAIRAVWQVKKFQNMPADKYHGWSQIDMDFDPRDML